LSLLPANLDTTVQDSSHSGHNTHTCFSSTRNFAAILSCFEIFGLTITSDFQAGGEKLMLSMMVKLFY